MNNLSKLNKIDDEYFIVGVSAGPDSMALLHMLINNTNKKLVCAHVNHNVRKASKEEQDFLKNYCENNNIIFELMKIDNYQENNFENEARKKRYAFYEEILKKYNSHTLLLAHHGDDLIETIIMKIIRGSNLEGYAGIKEVSNQKDYKIIRPLLNLTKKDIIKYNKENKIKYFIDKTNNNKKYTRNRIRLNILPLLKKEDSNIHLKFLKYSNTLQEYYNYVEDIVKDKLDKDYKNNIINIEVFKKEHPFIKKNIIFYILSNIYNNQDNIIKDKHIDDIIKMISNDKPNMKIDLPQGYVAKKEYNKVIFKKSNQKNEDYCLEFKDYLKINSFVIKKVATKDSDDNNTCRLNSKKIKLPLYVRNRRKGDYIELLGTDGKKKIKEIFIEKKLPLNNRDSYPILVDANDDILWIPNIKKSKYIVKKDDFYDIILTSYEESEEHNEKETK